MGLPPMVRAVFMATDTNSELELAVYPNQGVNDLFQQTTEHMVAAGGGGQGYGLFLSDGMLDGSSHPSATYGNECLASDEDFKVLEMEVCPYPKPHPYP